MSATYDQALAKAQAQPGYDAGWASATEHVRDCWPSVNRRRRCNCGCGGAASWTGGANGVALMSGCELSVRRWVRYGGVR